MKQEKHLWILLLSILLTILQLVGFYISSKYHTTVHTFLIRFWNYGSPKWTYLLAAFVEIPVFYLLFLYWFWALEKKTEENKIGFITSEVFAVQDVNAGIPKFLYLLTPIALFLCWLPYLLASYPGFFNYDISGQLAQVMYDTVPYVNHHPLLHTLIVGGIITFFYRISGENIQIGILAYCLFQMVFCSLFFTYFIFYLRKLTDRILPLVLSFLYYAFFPTIVLFTMSTTKDVMCLVFLQLSVLKLYEAFQMGLEQFFSKKSRSFSLIGSLTLSCLMRKNIIYAILLVMVLIFLFMRKEGKKILLSMGISLLLFFMVEQGLMLALHATNGGAAEAFSVPFQQIARVYNQYGEDGFTPDQFEMTLELITEENLRMYNPVLADPIKAKMHFPLIQKHPLGFLKYWASLFVKYPGSYVASFLENTYQAWYPGTSIIVDPAAHTYYYFDCNMSLGIDRYSKLPSLLRYIEKISLGEGYQKLIGFRALFSIGAMLWLVLIAFTYGLYQKNKGIIFSALLVICLCITNFLGPVSLVRYYLVLFYGFPFWGTLMLSPIFPGKSGNNSTDK